jgi:hypothetical protein
MEDIQYQSWSNFISRKIFSKNKEWHSLSFIANWLLIEGQNLPLECC